MTPRRIGVPLCEMCGSEHPRLTPVSVEGTQLLLCEECSRFGVAVTRSPTRTVSPARPRPRTRRAEPLEADYDLVSDVGTRIRQGREARGWKREELARRINEKLSIVEKLEKGKMRPDDALVTKLERVLQVRLRERIQEGEVGPKGQDRPLTLGDLIRRQE